jgi:hypothetical protein
MTIRPHLCGLVLAAACFVVGGGSAAAQQSAVASLPEEPPEVVLYRLGPVLVSPTFSIPELGRDSNVFNENEAPKEDFVVKLVPAIDFFAQMGLVSVAAKSGSTFTYFHRYASERSIAENIRGRVSAQLSRLRPWVGGASVRSSERTAEIDERAKRVERELGMGLNFEVSPLATLLVSGHRMAVRYDDDARHRGLALGLSLDRTTEMATAALRFQATPFTTVAFRGYTSRDAFAFDPLRDSRATGGEVDVNFGSEAVIRGHAAAGFRRQESNDPTVATFRGFTGRAGLTSILLWRALLGVEYVRDVQYSADRRDGYFVEHGVNVTYTQRIGGPFDVQARVGRGELAYDASALSAARTEVLWVYHGGVGYSLDSGSRIGISYESAERTGGRGDREFARKRVFASLSYEFWK